MLSQKVIQVCQEFGDEPIELPLEEDGKLLLSTLNSAFANATGSENFSSSKFFDEYIKLSDERLLLTQI